MRCVFSDLKDVCHFKYPGYKCIQEECDVWGHHNAIENECVYLDAHGCSKLNLLACKGKDNCVFFREFFESPTEIPKIAERTK